jgi:serine/threonine-protein kinase
MDRVVALKVLAPHLVETEKAQEMFRREVRAAARLIHPNIVTAYDANQVGGRHYLVMEYVDGPNLEELVHQRGPLPVGLACDLIRQAALGLQCAADMGMVHRDIKPANILLQNGGSGSVCVAKVLDFGLARLQDSPAEVASGSSLSRKNAVMGTPDFISPEQARTLHLVDIRSDLYSLGCTFYYLLTGKVPHPGGNVLEKLIRQSTEEPMPVELLRPEVSPAVAQVVRRLMAKDRAARFQTPAELAAALAPLAVQGPATWDGATPEQTLPGPQLTPPSSLVSGSNLPTPSPLSSPESALAGTLGMNFSPTPLSASDMPSVRSRREMDREQKHRLLIALALAVTIVAGLLGLVSLLLLS